MKRDIVEAAKMRARVVELLNQVPPEPRTMAEIQKELGIKTTQVKAFTSMVYRMAGNGLIAGYVTDQGKQYGAKDWHPESVVEPQAESDVKPKLVRTKRSYTKPKPAPTRVLDMLADLTVDISKTTGRIRLTTNGLTIDIGVIA